MSSLLQLDSPIEWSTITPESALRDIPFLIEDAKSQIAQLKQQEPSYKSTVLALDEITDKVFRAWDWVQHLNGVCNTPELRAVSRNCNPRLVIFRVRCLSMKNCGLYFRLRRQIGVCSMLSKPDMLKKRRCRFF